MAYTSTELALSANDFRHGTHYWIIHNLAGFRFAHGIEFYMATGICNSERNDLKYMWE